MPEDRHGLLCRLFVAGRGGGKAGKSYWTLRREVHLGRLHQSPGAVIAREELNRYLLDGRPAPGTSYAEQRLVEKLTLPLT